MPTSVRMPFFTPLLAVAFFLSGASCLIAEVAWNRMLIVVVGNSLSATAMIIVIFMGGLGLGSYLGGKFFGERRPSLLPYASIEFVVGLYVFLSPFLFDLLSRLFTGLSSAIQNPSGLTVVRLAVTLLALLLPATLMGATFPAIISGAGISAVKDRARRTGYLYSINTLGAAVGCFVAGYHLLLEIGVRFTLTLAFGLYVLAALCALAAHVLATRAQGEPLRAGRDAERTEGGLVEARPEWSERLDGSERPVRPASAVEVSGAAELRRFLYTATFAVGFVALAYEVLLTRLSILYLGNAVSVFPLVLTAFLLGTGVSAVLGTRLYGLWCRTETEARRFFGALALAAGLLVVLIPYLLLSDRVLGTSHLARLADATPRNPWPILLVIVAPTLLLGALLPVAIRMLRPLRGHGATEGAATLYALNTAGGVIGAGLANHFLVPAIGTQGVVLVLFFLCAVVGLVSIVHPGPRRSRWGLALAAAAASVILAGIALPSLAGLYAGKVARATGARSAVVRLVKEGRAATVTVIDQSDPTRGTYRDLYLNGVEEASTRFWHTQLFKLLGIFPVLTHASDGPKDVLVIAFGAGITAGSALASDEVQHLDVVDLNPDVSEINKLFVEVNGNVFHQPRFHFHSDDGRNYLVTSNRQYDVIINDSTHPRAYDSWILYTEEFYSAVKKRLRPGGVFAQWVPVLGSMQGDLMRIHLNTFRRAFPTATCWYVYGSDQAFLLATPERFEMDAPSLQSKLNRLPEWFKAGEYEIDTVERISGFFWMDEPAMNRMIAGETRVNRDNVHYFDKQSAVWPSPPQQRLPFFQASVLPYLGKVDDGLSRRIQARQALAGHLGRFAFFQQRDDLLKAFCADPEEGNVRFHMSLEFAGDVPEPESFCREIKVAPYREMVERHPGDPLALNALADALQETGRLDEALVQAENAIRLAPENGMILDTYGWILYRQGKAQPALEALKRADRFLPGHPIVLYHLGAAYLATGNARAGREHLSRALAASADFAGADEVRRLLAAQLATP